MRDLSVTPSEYREQTALAPRPAKSPPTRASPPNPPSPSPNPASRPGAEPRPFFSRSRDDLQPAHVLPIRQDVACSLVGRMQSSVISFAGSG